MSRLTKKIEDEATLNETGNVPCKTICDRMYKYDYPCDMCPIQDAINKLAHYEDMEEQGVLIKLPCKPEEIVFAAHEDCATVRVAYNSIEHILYDLEAGWCIGYTKEEAEAKLEKLKND